MLKVSDVFHRHEVSVARRENLLKLCKVEDLSDYRFLKYVTIVKHF